MRDKTMNGCHDSMQRENCPRGHKLELPNLVPSQLRRTGGPLRLACSRGKAMVQYHPDMNVQATCDWYYRRIMLRLNQ